MDIDNNLIKINSKQYWDKRFQMNWEQNNGREQTKTFAELAYSLFPDWLIRDIQSNSYNLCDIGCAQGDALNVFAKKFNIDLFGEDLSEIAIDKARSIYPQFSFNVVDILDDSYNKQFDVVYCSNMLEHFNNPRKVLAKLIERSKYYTILLIPFREKNNIKDIEHEISIDTSDIPIIINGSQLVFVYSVDCTTGYYMSEQLLLIYSKKPDMQHVANLSDFVEKVKNKDHDETCKNAINIKNEYDLLNTKYNDLDTLYRQISDEMVSANNNNSVLQNNYGKLQNDYDQIKVDLYKLHDKNNETQVLFNNLNTEFTLRKNEWKQYRDRLLQYIKNKDALIDDLNNKIHDRNFFYDDLYSYTNKLDIEFSRLKYSREYRIGKIVLKPFRFIIRILRKMYRILKAIITINHVSLKSEFYFLTNSYNKIIIYMDCRKQKKFIQYYNDMLQKAVSGNHLIIFTPTVDWHMPLFQRPHQLAKAYSKKERTCVIYLTQNISYDNLSYGEMINNNLFILNVIHLEAILPIIYHASYITISLSWTVNKYYIKKIMCNTLIYEYIDELKIFHLYSQEMEEDHKKILAAADVTVATAVKLYEKVIGLTSNPIYSTNAGDYEHFTKTKSIVPNDEVKNLTVHYDVILGYYGALANWFDYDLIHTVATLKPNWLWLLIGMDYDESLQNSGILRLNNVKYMGIKPYDELPSILTTFDIATIPFMINDITLSTSPVKLFEYMSGGKPILTSKMPECLKYKSVFTYDDSNDFIIKAENIMKISKSDPYWNLLEDEALNNTWDVKAKDILDALPKNKERRFINTD